MVDRCSTAVVWPSNAYGSELFGADGVAQAGYNIEIGAVSFGNLVTLKMLSFYLFRLRTVKLFNISGQTV